MIADSSQRFAPAIAAVLAVLMAGAPSVAEDEAFAELRRLVDTGQIDQSLTLADELVDQPDFDRPLGLHLARIARTLHQQRQIEHAAEFYRRAVDACTNHPPSSTAPETLVVLKLAAANVLMQSTQYPAAVPLLTSVLEQAAAATEQQQRLAVAASLQIGSRALSLADAPVAADAYRLALQHANEQEHPVALLGDAWATVSQPDQAEPAAEKLRAFVQQYPDHADAVGAAYTAVLCYRNAGNAALADQYSVELLERWPDSTEAFSLANRIDVGGEPVASALDRWLMDQATAGQVERFGVTLTERALVAAAGEVDQSSWTRLVKHLAAIDGDGQGTKSLLPQLAGADAERIAAVLLAPADDLKTTAAAMESAANWAAATGRWSLLASASESHDPALDSDRRSVIVERWFAESLMQVGRIKQAKAWWDHLVDSRKIDDFAVLLRCAEAETACGDDLQLARRRVAAIASAAAENPSRTVLADLLEAELAIRQTDFARARATLGRLVGTGAAASIQARAQWLVGETYYLQQDFTAAIRAYRAVQEIDPGGPWDAAALVQAGKSFEQLGRTRQASVCYGDLVDRFPDTAHARLARQRLAAIAPDQRQGDRFDTSPTIRR